MICCRYTSLVDRYIPNIATGLRDKSPLVRKQTLTLLTHLLQVCNTDILLFTFRQFQYKNMFPFFGISFVLFISFNRMNNKIKYVRFITHKESKNLFIYY